MCPYCHPDENGECESIKDLTDLDEGAFLDVYPETRSLGFGFFNCDGGGSDEVTINFCPMCGRKLIG